MQRVRQFPLLPLVVALQALFAVPAYAQSFTVNTNSSTGQTVTSGGTGTVASGVTLSTAAAVQAVTVTGTSGTVTLNNNGSIEQTGTARAIRNNTTGVTFVVNNQGSITALADDVIKVGNSGFRLTNLGTIWQQGTGTASGQALDLRDIVTPTGNFINNGSVTNRTALIRADGDDALRPGNNTTITNYGIIISNGAVNTRCPDYLPAASCAGKPSAHDAIDAGGRTGIVINNYGLINGPRHAITADTSITVTNFADGQIIGRNGSGVGSDGTGTVTNYGLISGRYAGAGKGYDQLANGATTTNPLLTTVNNGDGDGVDIDGIGTVSNYGRIEGLGGGGLDSGGRPNGGDGLALGGGTVTNFAGGVIWGKSNGILVDDGANGTDTTNTAANKNRGTATAAAGAVSITNSGEITGDRRVGIGLVGNWNDTVTNNATGVITGGVDAQQVDMLSTNPAQRPGAAIQMGAGDDTLTNFGRIEGKNGLAIDMGAGDDVTRLLGGTVIGTVDGGAGIDTLETGGMQIFSAGTVINFERFIVRNGATIFNYGLGTVASVQVDAGASLQVNGALAATGNLLLDGTFKAATDPQPRTMTVGGNLSVGAAGVLEAGVGGSSADRIVVTGTANLANGASLKPIIRSYVVNGSRYTLVSAAGGLTTTPGNLQVVSQSALVRYFLSNVGNDLVLTALRQATLSSLAPAGLGSMGVALEALGQTPGAPPSPLLVMLDNMTSLQAVTDALQQLGPDVSQAGQAASNLVTGSVFSAFERRVDSARGGVQTAEPAKTGLSGGSMAGRRAWAQGLGAWGAQGQRSGANGFRLQAYGVAAGLEVDRKAHEIMGLSIALTQAATDGTNTAQGDNLRLGAVNVGGYFSQSNADMTFDAAVMLGQSSYKTQRVVAFPGVQETLTGNYKGWQLAGRIEAGFPFAISADLSGRWLVGARAGVLTTGGYDEAGSTAVAQRISASSTRSLQSVLGAELTHALTPTSSLRVQGRYLREFASAPGITAAFVSGGPSFTTTSLSPSRNTLQLGVSFRQVTRQGVSINMGYDLEAKEKYLSHQLSARASWAF